jgi:hypothetical protein
MGMGQEAGCSRGGLLPPATLTRAIASHPTTPAAAMVSTLAKVAANPRRFLTMESPRSHVAWVRALRMEHYGVGFKQKLWAGGGFPAVVPTQNL